MLNTTEKSKKIEAILGNITKRNQAYPKELLKKLEHNLNLLSNDILEQIIKITGNQAQQYAMYDAREQFIQNNIKLYALESQIDTGAEFFGEEQQNNHKIVIRKYKEGEVTKYKVYAKDSTLNEVKDFEIFPPESDELEALNLSYGSGLPKFLDFTSSNDIQKKVKVIHLIESRLNNTYEIQQEFLWQTSMPDTKDADLELPKFIENLVNVCGDYESLSNNLQNVMDVVQFSGNPTRSETFSARSLAYDTTGWALWGLEVAKSMAAKAIYKVGSASYSMINAGVHWWWQERVQHVDKIVDPEIRENLNQGIISYKASLDKAQQATKEIVHFDVQTPMQQKEIKARLASAVLDGDLPQVIDAINKEIFRTSFKNNGRGFFNNKSEEQQNALLDEVWAKYQKTMKCFADLNKAKESSDGNNKSELINLYEKLKLAYQELDTFYKLSLGMSINDSNIHASLTQLFLNAKKLHDNRKLVPFMATAGIGALVWYEMEYLRKDSCSLIIAKDFSDDTKNKIMQKLQDQRMPNAVILVANAAGGYKALFVDNGVFLDPEGVYKDCVIELSNEDATTKKLLKNINETKKIIINEQALNEHAFVTVVGDMSVITEIINVCRTTVKLDEITNSNFVKEIADVANAVYDSRAIMEQLEGIYVAPIIKDISILSALFSQGDIITLFEHLKNLVDNKNNSSFIFDNLQKFLNEKSSQFPHLGSVIELLKLNQGGKYAEMLDVFEKIQKSNMPDIITTKLQEIIPSLSGVKEVIAIFGDAKLTYGDKVAAFAKIQFARDDKYKEFYKAQLNKIINTYLMAPFKNNNATVKLLEEKPQPAADVELNSTSHLDELKKIVGAFIKIHNDMKELGIETDGFIDVDYLNKVQEILDIVSVENVATNTDVDSKYKKMEGIVSKLQELQEDQNEKASQGAQNYSVITAKLNDLLNYHMPLFTVAQNIARIMQDDSKNWFGRRIAVASYLYKNADQSDAVRDYINSIRFVAKLAYNILLALNFLTGHLLLGNMNLEPKITVPPASGVSDGLKKNIGKQAGTNVEANNPDQQLRTEVADDALKGQRQPPVVPSRGINSAPQLTRKNDDNTKTPGLDHK